MGVDITAYSDLKKINADYNDAGDIVDANTGEILDDAVYLYANEHFLDRAKDIEEGFYTYADSDTRLHLSYGAYNLWREKLSKMAGYPTIEDAWNADNGAFWELINFADNEGLIGTQACIKLAKDFSDYENIANSSIDVSFKDYYFCLKEAFEMASNNGAIVFS